MTDFHVPLSEIGAPDRTVPAVRRLSCEAIGTPPPNVGPLDGKYWRASLSSWSPPAAGVFTHDSGGASEACMNSLTGGWAAPDVTTV